MLSCGAYNRLPGEPAAAVLLRQHVQSAVQQLRTLSGGTLTQNTQMERERPSVVLRACRGDEDIWDVAKRYGTTVAAVREANGLESGEPERDCLLLIPM